MTPEEEVVILFLAALTSGIPASFVHWSLAKKIKEGVVLNTVSNRIVTKAKGMQLYLTELGVWTFLTVGLDMGFQRVYTDHFDRIPFSFLGVIMGLAVITRMRIGGKFTRKEKYGYMLTYFAAVGLFLFGIGADRVFGKYF